jgi:hypothetical protein
MGTCLDDAWLGQVDVELAGREVRDDLGELLPGEEDTPPGRQERRRDEVLRRGDQRLAVAWRDQVGLRLQAEQASCHRA